MRIGIFGASGFIGRALGEALRARGDEVVGFSRGARGEGWRTSEGSLDLSGLDAVVNLAGESVAARWSRARKSRMHTSRIGLTGRIVQALHAMGEEERPRALLSSSATGFYGEGGENLLLEDCSAGEDYLAQLCLSWEEAALEAEEAGVRVVLLRSGIVLGVGGKAWEQMSRVFRLGLGGRLGSGRQWMPWIHLSDEVRGILFLLDHQDARGAFNMVAPEPVRNEDWTKCFARQFRRPALFPVPGFALQMLFGGFGKSLLQSSRVLPARLGKMGYSFSYPDLPKALEDLSKASN